MSRKFALLLLATSLVLGLFSVAAAQPATTVSQEQDVDKGVSDDVLYVVPDGKPDGASYGEYPGFVDELKGLGKAYSIMVREQVQINGEPMVSSLPPVIVDGRILIPVRAVATSLGAEVVWDADEKTVTITRDGVEIVIAIGEEEITVNGTIQVMDASAQILAGHTFLPVRFVATALGDSVIWNPVAKEAIINSQQDNSND